MIDLTTTIRKTLRVEEVMEIFGVSRRSVYNWVEQKKIPSVIIEGKVRIEVEELRRLLGMIDSDQPPNPFQAHSIITRAKSARSNGSHL